MRPSQQQFSRERAVVRDIQSSLPCELNDFDSKEAFLRFIKNEFIEIHLESITLYIIVS